MINYDNDDSFENNIVEYVDFCLDRCYNIFFKTDENDVEFNHINMCYYDEYLYHKYRYVVTWEEFTEEVQNAVNKCKRILSK